jgi:hypothetical protein
VLRTQSARENHGSGRSQGTHGEKVSSCNHDFSNGTLIE